jgi:hypothetical protein
MQRDGGGIALGVIVEVRSARGPQERVEVAAGAALMSPSEASASENRLHGVGGLRSSGHEI